MPPALEYKSKIVWAALCGPAKELNMGRVAKGKKELTVTAAEQQYLMYISVILVRYSLLLFIFHLFSANPTSRLY